MLDSAYRTGVIPLGRVCKRGVKCYVEKIFILVKTKEKLQMLLHELSLL